MKTSKNFFIIMGCLFLLFALGELILCFYGPIVLEVKSTIFIFPLYSIKEDPGIAALRSRFSEHLAQSRKYIVIGERHARELLAQDGKQLETVMDLPSSTRYAEAAKVIGAEKFIMGYILGTEGGGYELFVNIHITKQAESVLKEKMTVAGTANLAAEMRAFVTKLDGDGGEKSYSLPEVLYFYALLFYALFGLFLVLHTVLAGTEKRITALIKFHIPDALVIYTLLLFIFAYIYALNANMDYVQTFMATGGKLNLAQNTEQERINSMFRYFPLLGVSGFCFFWMRFKRKSLGLAELISGDFRVLWALPLTLLSALLASLSLPSALDINGWPVLGYFCLVPLLLVMEKNSYPACVLYGTIWGTYNTVITSYWLGTFNLVSLQIVMLIFVISYLFFMLPAVWIYRRAGALRFLVFPAGWVAFDYLQSLGFAGYPWGMLGASQYAFLPLIQMSAVTGVWGVSLVVLMGNAGLAHIINSVLAGKRQGRWVPLCVFGALFAVAVSGGLIYMGITGAQQAASGRGTVRIAQVQDSMDPRKHTTTDVMEVLQGFTDTALQEKPDLVAWPEGSFNTDYIAFPTFLIVEDLRAYQQTTGTWLLTGSMEYKDKELAFTSADTTELDMYNSTMLLAPDGSVKDHYYKMHLVPFTEHFPYKEQLPWMYKMLKEFDISWWEKGETRVIFEHPKFKFFTPICYEDVFPGEIALFVKDGADVIMNLSNDFWSLSPVEGKQHAIDSLFRAVENARPLLRTTTSGLTCYVDINGRIKKTLPYYQPGYYVVDVPLPGKGLTLYTMTGDWLPWFLLAGLVVLFGVSFFPWYKKRN